MKKNFVLLMFSMIVLSCSSDDGTTSGNNVSAGDYLPLTNGNSWTYNIQGGLQTGTDILYINDDRTVNGNVYKQFMTESLPLGFYSNALNNNGIRKDGDRLLLTGTAMMPFIEDFPISINLTDFAILDESASNGELLATTNGTLPYQFDEYNFNFNYTLSSVAMGTMATYTAPNGEVYTNVKPVRVKLNVMVNTLINAGPTTIPITIMPSQDVVVSTHYFAKDIGVVHTATNVHYELSNLSQFGITLPIPQSFTEEQYEMLTNYNLN